MKIGLIINGSKKDALPCSLEVVSLFNNEGAEVLVKSEFKDFFYTTSFFDTDKEIIENCDVVVTIGGDGTIIDAGKYAAKEKKPLIGVNLGRIGFVAGIERNELYLLKNIVKNDYSVQKRMLLEYIIEEEGKEPSSFVALNEVTLQRDIFSSVIEFSVDLNNETIITYRADGIIFSTSTGSTAYSFSAGGPVISPDMDCILLNPLCPHALSSRQVIFSSDSVLDLKLLDKRQKKAYLTADGQNIQEITPAHNVKIKKSDLTLDLIILKEKNFYTLLNEKLKEGK